MNRSETLRALEWVDQAARDGDADRLVKAKQVLQDELASKKSSHSPDDAYRIAFESFVRKHAREPLEDILDISAP